MFRQNMLDLLLIKDNGTAKDVLDVIYHVKDEVKKQFGVDLYPEVRILGED